MRFGNLAWRAGLAAACWVLHPVAAVAAELTVEVRNVEPGQSTLYVGLFATPEGFPQRVQKGQSVPASARLASGVVVVKFHDLEPGQYAVSAYEDLDGDGKLSTNLVGAPTEPYGFTNDAVGQFGPPSFQDAAFALPPDGSLVSVNLR